MLRLSLPFYTRRLGDLKLINSTDNDSEGSRCSPKIAQPRRKWNGKVS